MLKGFRDFLIRGNAIELAVAVVVGAAFNGVINALVRDFITPFIGIIWDKRDLSSFYFTVRSSKFMIGDFINNIISLIIVSAVVYFFIVIPMNTIIKKMGIAEKNKEMLKSCPECLSLIPAKAKRCKYCTSVLSK